MNLYTFQLFSVAKIGFICLLNGMTVFVHTFLLLLHKKPCLLGHPQQTAPANSNGIYTLASGTFLEFKGINCSFHSAVPVVYCALHCTKALHVHYSGLETILKAP